MLFSRHLESKDHSHREVIRLLKYLLNGIMTTFTTDSLAKAASKDVLKDVTAFLLTSTHDSKLTNLEECDTVIKTINILMLKIIQNSDHTSCFWYVVPSLLKAIRFSFSYCFRLLLMLFRSRLSNLFQGGPLSDLVVDRRPLFTYQNINFSLAT